MGAVPIFHLRWYPIEPAATAGSYVTSDPSSLRAAWSHETPPPCGV